MYLNVRILSLGPAENTREVSRKDGGGSQVASRRRTRKRKSGGEAVLSEQTLLLDAVTVRAKEILRT